MIREFRPEDVRQVRNLFHELVPELPAHTDRGILHWIASHPPRARLRCWVAIDAGEIVGWGIARFNWSVSAEGVSWLWVGVREQARRRGIGSGLYALAEAHLVEGRARKLETFAAPDSAGERFAERRGFRKTRAEHFLTLDPHETDLSGLPRIESEKAVEGFRVAPLRDVLDRPRELHALYAAAEADVPADEIEDNIPYEDWVHETLEAPDLDRDGSFVVLAGERPVALSFLHVNRELGVAENEMTGTLPEFRRRGLARLAKLATIQWARENGVTEISTGNDRENAAMRSLNEQLGYRLRLVRVQLVREL